MHVFWKLSKRRKVGKDVKLQQGRTPKAIHGYTFREVINAVSRLGAKALQTRYEKAKRQNACKRGGIQEPLPQAFIRITLQIGE